MFNPPTDPRTAKLISAYEGLRRDNLSGLLALYDAQARFKDPFNDVSGHAAIKRVFEHMFASLVQPRFVVVMAVTQGNDAVLTWNFHFRRQEEGAPWLIHGASHLHYTPEGRVSLHRDYWDTAEELYAKLPLVGAATRWLTRRLKAT